LVSHKDKSDFLSNTYKSGTNTIEKGGGGERDSYFYCYALCRRLYVFITSGNGALSSI